MPDAVTRIGRAHSPALNTHEETAMNRKLTLTLTLAVALASQFALGGCSKKEDITPAADTSASAPSGNTMAASAAPMDSISSASAVAGADSAASAAVQAASDAAMAASH
jgi:hypothetical protein